MTSSRVAITPADVARFPAPGLGIPVRIGFSSDGRWLAWLHASDGGLERRLHLHDVATGATEVIDSPSVKVDESTLSLEEKLRRERTRDVGRGIATYSWMKMTAALIVPTAHDVWRFDVDRRTWSRVLEVDDAVIVDPQLSPDDSQIAWVQDGELMAAHLGEAGEAGEDTVDSDAIRMLTTRVADGVCHGVAEFIAQEEMKRFSGYWWSPDSSKIAYVEVDERDVEAFPIWHLADADPLAHETHRYPFTGAANAKVRLFVVDVETSDTIELDIAGHEYLARARWASSGELYVQLQDRLQRRLELRRFSVGSDGSRLDAPVGAPVTVLVETSDTWINLHDMFRPLDDGSFIWASERSGYLHLELRDRDGGLVRELTSGSSPVDAVVGVDEKQRKLWFVAGSNNPLERHLHQVSFDGDALGSLTYDIGTHHIVADVERMRFADLHSAFGRQPRLELIDIETGATRTLVEMDDPRVDSFGLQPPELTTVETADRTLLHVAIFRPEGDGPFPTLDAVYGGPHIQLVTNSWGLTASLRAQYLRSLGFCVVMIDGRGSARRGHAFEAAIHRNLGDLEVRDHVEALRVLADRGIVDLDRVGVYGWSYGGYLSAMCLARAPGVYKRAVAGAPVTNWESYDTHYTERYMGLPVDNPEGYRASSVMTHVEQITGRLMLIHGLLDENVHVRHTVRLIDALIDAGIDNELLLYPSERHLPRDHADRTHMEARIAHFLAPLLSNE